jgi:hypothetical protein
VELRKINPAAVDDGDDGMTYENTVHIVTLVELEKRVLHLELLVHRILNEVTDGAKSNRPDTI